MENGRDIVAAYGTEGIVSRDGNRGIGNRGGVIPATGSPDTPKGMPDMPKGEKSTEH